MATIIKPSIKFDWAGFTPERASKYHLNIQILFRKKELQSWVINGEELIDKFELILTTHIVEIRENKIPPKHPYKRMLANLGVERTIEIILKNQDYEYLKFSFKKKLDPIAVNPDFGINDPENDQLREFKFKDIEFNYGPGEWWTKVNIIIRSVICREDEKESPDVIKSMFPEQ